MTEFKIFVSSTFKDMYAERDILHRQVSAILAKRIAESDLDCKVKFVDLRWGIDDRSDFADRSEFIIEKCFTSISECDLFLCILGDTLGTCVDSQVLSRYSSLPADTQHGYTELEIEYAKKHFDSSQLIFICSSPSENEETGARALKDKLSLDFDFLTYDKHNDKVSPEFISHCVESVFNKIKSTSGQRKRSNPYFKRKSIMSKIEEMRKENRSILLFGENGTGKTAVLDCLAIEYEARGYEVYLSEGLRKGINSSFPRDLSLWVGSENENLSRDIELLKKQISRSKDVILIADKIDDERPGDIFMLYRAFSDIPNVTILMSLSDEQMLNYLKAFNMGIVNIGALLPEEIAPYMLHIANRYGKRLFDEVVTYVANSTEPIFGNALYLELLTDQLCIMDSSSYTRAKQQSDNFVSHIIDEMIALVDSAPRSIKELIDFKIADFDKYLSPEFSHLVIGIIISYRGPIHLTTLKDIYNKISGHDWDEINYYTLCYYLREFIVEVNEQLYYISPYVEQELEAKFESFTLKDDFEQAVFDSLLASSLDKERLLLSALILDKDLFYEMAMSNDTHYCALALGMFLKSDSKFGIIPLFSRYYGKLCKILNRCGGRACARVFNEALAFVEYNGNDKIVDYISLSYKKISAELTDIGDKISILGGILYWFSASGLEHRSADFIKYSLDLLSSSEISSCMGKEKKELFELLYYAIDILNVFDQTFTIRRLLSSFRNMLITTELVRITPLFLEAIMKLDKALFVDMLNGIDLESPPSDRNLISSYINCLKHKITYCVQIKDIDTAYPLSEKMYIVAREEYERNPSQVLAIYDYTQALNLYGFLHQSDRVGIREELYDDMYKIRLILAYAEPDNFISVSGLFTCIANIIRNNVKISITYEQMLLVLIDRVRMYAQRGNIRVGWLIVNMFKDLSKNNEALNALRRIIFEIDSFLEPIITNTGNNTANLIEIIQGMLNVYHYYCEARILPLDEGKHLLGTLMSYASRLVDLCADEQGCELYYLVARELFMVLIQNSTLPVTALSSKEFSDFEVHTRELTEKNPCKETKILATVPDLIRIFAHAMLLLGQGNALTLKLFEATSGCSVASALKELVIKCYEALREYIVAKQIAPSFVEPLYLGASVIKKSIPDADKIFDEIIGAVSSILMQQR